MGNIENGNINDLEDFQYEDIYYESDEPLDNIATKIIHQGFTIGIIIFLIILLSGFVFKIPIERNFDFVLKNSEKEIIYRYIDFITIEKTFVEAGDHVNENDTLAIINSEKISSYINDYQNAINKLNNFYLTDTLIYKNKIGLLYDKLIMLNKSKNAEQKIIDIIKKRKNEELINLDFIFEKSNNLLEIDKELHKRDAISDIAFKETEAKKIKDETYREMTKYNYEKIILEKSLDVGNAKIKSEMIVKEIEVLRNELIKKQEEIKNELEYTHNKLASNYKNFIISKNNTLVLLSPCNGIVSFIKDKSEKTEEKEILLKIIKNKSKLYAQIEVEPYNIGYLKNGQTAVLKVSTFPFYEWGIVKAKLSNISISPNAKGNYLIKLTIEDKGSLKDKLSSGMTGRASILTNEKTMFGLLFEKMVVFKENFEN